LIKRNENENDMQGGKWRIWIPGTSRLIYGVHLVNFNFMFCP